MLNLICKSDQICFPWSCVFELNDFMPIITVLSLIIACLHYSSFTPIRGRFYCFIYPALSNTGQRYENTNLITNELLKIRHQYQSLSLFFLCSASEQVALPSLILTALKSVNHTRNHLDFFGWIPWVGTTMLWSHDSCFLWKWFWFLIVLFKRKIDPKKLHLCIL